VEGSHARIISNKLDSNIKANIALGGKNSGLTRIKYNYIEHSKSEGIFIVEGEERLLIEDNQIMHNNDGIVCLDSNGFIKENNIKMNQRAGILTCGETTVVIDSNTIEDNQTAGIIIKDPSLPEIKRNEICKNFFQIKMEKHASKEWKRI
jgi:parallel beta-helix repeat protein